MAKLQSGWLSVGSCWTHWYLQYRCTTKQPRAKFDLSYKITIYGPSAADKMSPGFWSTPHRATLFSNLDEKTTPQSKLCLFCSCFLKLTAVVVVVSASADSSAPALCESPDVRLPFRLSHFYLDVGMRQYHHQALVERDPRPADQADFATEINNGHHVGDHRGNDERQQGWIEETQQGRKKWKAVRQKGCSIYYSSSAWYIWS